MIRYFGMSFLRLHVAQQCVIVERATPHFVRVCVCSRLREVCGGAGEWHRPVGSERAALPLSCVWQGVWQAAYPLQTHVSTHR